MSLTIDADFPGGAVEDVVFKSNTQIEFKVPLKGSPRGMWFYFRITGAYGKELDFHVKNVEQILNWPQCGSILPVVRNGQDGEWQRLSDNNVFFSHEDKSLSFRVSVLHDEVYIAYCYPYQLRDLLEFTQKNQDNDLFHIEYPGYTAEGRKFPMIIIGDPKRAGKFFVCTARAHAGEVSGSYVLEGIMEKLLEHSDDGEKIRNELFAVIFPILDLDSVEEGRYGKDRPPVDFNRDWTSDSIHPEIRIVQEKIDEFACKYKYCFYADLHAPGPGPFTYMVPSAQLLHDSTKREKIWTDIWRFGNLLENKAPEEFPFRVKDYPKSSLGWSGELLSQTGTAYNALKYGVHSATFELSYHKSTNGIAVIPEYWRKFGKVWLDSLYSFLILEEESIPVEKPESSQCLKSARLMCGLWNLDVDENETGKVTAKALGEGNQLWLAYYREIPVEGRKAEACLHIVKNTEENLCLRIYCYPFKNGVRLRKYDRRDILFSANEDKITVHFDKMVEADSIRVAIRIENIKGSVEVELV